MKLKQFLSCVVALILIVSICVYPVSGEEVQANLSVTNGCHSIDGAMPFLGRDRVVQNAGSAFLFETNSETLLYEWNADTPMYPASLVKLMTALVVLENSNLQDVVTVSESALKSVDIYSQALDLTPGERMTVEQMLYCLLVRSANEAATILAEHVSGSESDFVTLMNKRAAELGCTGTNYTNPHGIHNAQQVTTARDVCRVLQAALKIEVFRTIFGTVSYQLPATNMHDKARNLSSNNHLMNQSTFSHYYDERVMGGRVGETEKGLRCVATVSQSGNMEVICVVMGSKPIYSEDGKTVKDYGGFYETTTLLNKAYTGYARRQIVAANQILRQQDVTDGDCGLMVASRESFATVLPSDITLEQLSFQYQDILGCDKAPVQKGQNVAYLQVWYGSMCIAQTDVYAMNDVPKAFVKTAQLQEPKKDSSVWVVVLIVIGAVVLFAGAVLAWIRLRKKPVRHYDDEIRRRR